MVKPLLLSCSLSLLLAAASGCVGGDSDFQEGNGKAEYGKCLTDQFRYLGDCVRPDQVCESDQVMINGACHPEEVQVNLHMISGKITDEDVFSGETWDSKDAAEALAHLPDPVVDITITDPETGVIVNSGVSPVIQDDDQPRWEHAPFEVKGHLMEISLEHLTSPYNKVGVKDDDDKINHNLLGECALDPTEVEIAEGIIRVKGCTSTKDTGTIVEKKKGKESNILELVLGITVAPPQ